MFCTNCGKQASGAGKFCSSCGSALKQDIQQSSPKETAHSEPPGLKDNANNNEVIRLAGLAMSGDDSVWGEIYERTNRYVYFMALKSLPSEQDAQDITQEVYMQAIRSIGQLYNAESFFGWLRSIVTSKCKDLVKKKKPALLEDESPGLLDSMPEVSDRFLPDMTLDNSESKRMVLELVDALPYQQRQTILFYYYDEMTVDQIAALMECPAGTVKSRLNYARQQIKAGVEEHERKGVKLYGAATLPILTMLLREQAKALPIPSSLDSSMMPIIKSMSAPQSGTSPPGGYTDSANPAAPSDTYTPYGNAKAPDNYTTNPAPQAPQGYASPPPAPGAGVASVTGNTASAVGEAVAGSVASSAAGAVASSAVATAATAISTKVIAIIVASVIAVGGGVFALTRGGGDETPPTTWGSVTENVGMDSNAGRSSMDNTSDNTSNTTPGNNAAVGDIIEFGGYEWRVLEVRDGNALIITENIIERRAYNVGGHDTTWEYSSLRRYLNGEFFDSFTQAERARIVETRIANADNQWYGTAGGRETADRIFLISLEEVVQYFGDSGQLSHRPSNDEWRIDDRFNSMRIAGDLTGNNPWWWLRSPGINSDLTAFVGSNGTVHVNGDYAEFHGGVRPALWLTLENTASPSAPTPPPGNNAAVGDIIEFGGY